MDELKVLAEVGKNGNEALKPLAQVARDKSLKVEEVLNQAHELRRRELIEKKG